MQTSREVKTQQQQKQNHSLLFCSIQWKLSKLFHTNTNAKSTAHKKTRARAKNIYAFLKQQTEKKNCKKYNNNDKKNEKQQEK